MPTAGEEHSTIAVAIDEHKYEIGIFYVVETKSLLTAKDIFDTSASDQHNEARNKAYSWADGFMFTYSIGSMESFEHSYALH